MLVISQNLKTIPVGPKKRKKQTSGVSICKPFSLAPGILRTLSLQNVGDWTESTLS